jgi:hypothetical protein
MRHWFKPLAAALMLPLLLAGCLFMPGKFDSTLIVNADRSFTFTYKGEVMAVDLQGAMAQAMSGMAEVGKAGEAKGDELSKPAAPPTAEEKAKQDQQYRDMAKELAKEAGYRSVEYRGNGVFYVDYAISGTLNHNFVYPYNQDAAMLFPWVAIELRGKDMVRVQAPGFAKQDLNGMGDPAGEAEGKLDGTFTLTTTGTVVEENSQVSAKGAGSDTSTTFSWKVNSDTTQAPKAVIRVAPLP